MLQYTFTKLIINFTEEKKNIESNNAFYNDE